MDFFLLLFSLLWLMLFWNICGDLFWCLLLNSGFNLLFYRFLLFFNHSNFFLLSTFLLLWASWLSFWLLLVNLACHVSFSCFINFDFLLMLNIGNRHFLLWRWHNFLLLLLLLWSFFLLLFSSLLSLVSICCRASLFIKNTALTYGDMCLWLCFSGYSSMSASQVFFKV